jgi:hypothetical protein
VISGKSDLTEHDLVNVPKCYGGNSPFAITREAGPWCDDVVGIEESKDEFSEMIEQEDDQVDLLDDRDSFDMGDLRA